MGIPELERKRAEAVLARFCNRVPPHIRPKLSYVFRTGGNAIVLFERRPRYDQPTEHTEIAFVHFCFDPSHTWALQCADRNGRWHRYEGFDRVRRFADLVAEVERDPTGIFLG